MVPKLKPPPTDAQYDACGEEGTFTKAFPTAIVKTWGSNPACQEVFNKLADAVKAENEAAYNAICPEVPSNPKNFPRVETIFKSG